MAVLAAKLKNADRMIAAARAGQEGIVLVFADGRTGEIPFAEVPDIGRLSNLQAIDIPNPYELVLTSTQGVAVELPWDFARHFCDPAYQPRVEAIAAAGRSVLGKRVQQLREAKSMT